MIIRSLRTKLALSHIVPILLLAPLLSLYLIYSLEEFFTQKLLQQLTQQTRLIFAQVQQDPSLVTNPTAAQHFLAIVAQQTDVRVLLLNQTGVILGSSRAEDKDRIGGIHPDPAVQQTLQGAFVQGVGPGFTSEVAYVITPVRQGNSILGALRLSYEVDDVRSQFNQVRRFVLGGVALVILLGLGLGLGLALTITLPLRQLSERVQEIAAGNYQALVTFKRQDEVGSLAENFNQMAIHLEEERSARRQQLAAIVHELARPLTGMRAAVETLIDGAEDDVEMRSDLLTGMAEELARLERLIRTLQDVQRRGSQPMQLERKPVSLERLIRASVANFEPAASQLGVELAAEIAQPLPPVLADEDRVIQVLTNLLDNALKFTPRGGWVRVTAGEKADVLWVSVADSGEGISPAELPYIFRHFYHGDELDRREKHGMGLGLTISREIIETHQGEITVTSEVGKGTQFVFTLPKA